MQVVIVPFLNCQKQQWREFKRLCNETITTDTVNFDAIYKNIVKIIKETAENVRRGVVGNHSPIKRYENDCRSGMKTVEMQFTTEKPEKMNKNRTPDNIQEYRRLKGIAQKTIKNSAATYWGDYCNTLNRTTKLKHGNQSV